MMEIRHFFDSGTSTISYVVYDPTTRVAIVIDPVLDFDPASGQVSHGSFDTIAAFIRDNGLRVELALDTHPHADHLTALPLFREQFGARIGIGEGIRAVQETWANALNLGPEFHADGSQFDLLLNDGERVDVGPLTLEAILTEGHTPASMTFKIGDALFVGDLMFMPDSGTARCDFPGGSAEDMYDSVRKLFELPDETRVFTCHDYQPGGRELRFESTIGDQRRDNVHLDDRVSKSEFVALRRRLEAGKPAPRLLYPAVQVNIRGGGLPEPESNGVRYLKIPVTT